MVDPSPLRAARSALLAALLVAALFSLAGVPAAEARNPLGGLHFSRGVLSAGDAGGARPAAEES